MYLRIILIFIFLLVAENYCLAGCGGFKESIGLYCDDVQVLHDKGIISGYEDGTFNFFDPLSRADLTKMAVLAKAKIYNISESEIEKYGKTKCFSDVKSEHWSSKYICYANDKENNIVNGCNEKENKFCPNNKITYDEASKIILKTLSDGKNCWKSNNGDLYTYVEYMNNILDANISHSYEVTRALFAHMLNSAMKEENINFIKSCLDDDGLLAKFSPLMAFYEDDKNPVAIDSFIRYSILYKTENPIDDVQNQIVGFGANLPDVIPAKKITTVNYKQDYAEVVESPLPALTNSTKFSENENFNLKGTYFFDFRNGGKNGGKDYGYHYCDDINCYSFEIDANISFSPDDITKSSKKTVYGRVFRDSGMVYLQYFFFYLMNDWNSLYSVIGGFHESDWEGIIIELDSKQVPIRMGVSIHGQYQYSKTKKWNFVNKVSDETNDHPIVYIGYKGHPTYFEKGKDSYLLDILYTDYHDSDQKILYYERSPHKGYSINSKADVVPYSIVNIESDTSTKSWFLSNIYWGEDFRDIKAKSVASPGSVCSHDPERWSNPKKWLDCNVQCTENECNKNTYCKEEIVNPDYCMQ